MFCGYICWQYRRCSRRHCHRLIRIRLITNRSCRVHNINIINPVKKRIDLAHSHSSSYLRIELASVKCNVNIFPTRRILLETDEFFFCSCVFVYLHKIQQKNRENNRTVQFVCVFFSFCLKQILNDRQISRVFKFFIKRLWYKFVWQIQLKQWMCVENRE